MFPLAALAGAIGWNYWEHRHGRQTMCAFTRKYVPPVVFVAAWGVLTHWIVPHYIDGFRIDLERLTD